MFKPAFEIMQSNSSIKVVLFTSKVLKNGESPIMLRVIKDRKTKYISIGHSCLPKHWDLKNQKPKNSFPNKRMLDILIDTKINEAQKTLLDLEINQTHFSLETVTQKIKKTQATKNVYDFIDSIVHQKTLENKLGNASVYKQTKNMLINFTKKNEIYFNEITPSFLNKYESYFRMKGSKEVSISQYMRTLRAVYNSAITEGIATSESYPFKEYSISKLSTKTVKRAITKDDIKKIIALDLGTDSRLNDSKNVFLFSYLTMGTNFTDLAQLKWTNIQNDRLKYIRAKTNKPYDVGLLPPALDILQYYKKNNLNNEYIFPILNDFHNTALRIKNRIHKVLKQTNDDLKEIATLAGIDVNLTTYVARHTYATVLKYSGVSTSVISEALGHDSEKTTQIYLDSFQNDVLDEANKNLL
jgi:integrase/recombinase XerD